MVFVPAVLAAVKGRADWRTVVLAMVMVGEFPHPEKSSDSVSSLARSSNVGNKIPSVPG